MMNNLKQFECISYGNSEYNTKQQEQTIYKMSPECYKMSKLTHYHYYILIYHEKRIQINANMPEVLD